MSCEERTREPQGIFTFDKKTIIMRKWQILEFDGKPYYAFVPENDTPIAEEEIPEQEEEAIESNDKSRIVTKNEREEDNETFDYDSVDEKLYDNNVNALNDEEDDEELDVKPIILNGANEEDSLDKSSFGDLYQVKVDGGTVTLEKLRHELLESSALDDSDSKVNQGLYKEISEDIEISEHDENTVQEDVIDQEETSQENYPADHEANEPEHSHDFEESFDQTFQEEEDVYDENTQSENIEYLEEEEDEEEMGEEMSAPEKTSQEMLQVGGILRCKVCSETFGSATAFRKHVAWTHKKKICIQEDGAYICAVCDYRTLKKSLFAAHLERKHETWSRKRPNAVMFPCEACGFVCRSKHSLQSHFTRKHTDRYEHHCLFCPKKFKVKGDLTNHVRFHHKERPLNCDVCGKLCQNSGSLYVHQKWAHYKPKYECPICKRRMVTQENLDQHLLTQHEKREKIVCAECGKTFTKKDSFKRHMAVHTGSKPHSCLICNKPFARRSQLRQHLLIHTGKRPFVCDICGKSFTQKPGLICHRKTHPGPHPPLPVMPIADIVKEFTEEYLQDPTEVLDVPESQEVQEIQEELEEVEEVEEPEQE